MKTLAVWPSQISEEVKNDIIQFAQEWIWAISHRSEQFTEISKKVHINLREFLGIPEDYKIFYTASSTEAMEIITRNFIESKSYHFVNWVFSNKFYEAAKTLGKKSNKQELGWWKWNFDISKIEEDAELIWITHNETTTWVMVSDDFTKEIRNKYKDKLLAVDITSSVWCVSYDIKLADIWFFSVQKGFGLPAGLWMFIASKKALKKYEVIKRKGLDTGFVHSIENMLSKYDKYQTHETPNVFAIYLLWKQLERMNKKTLEKIEQETIEKYNYIDSQVKNHSLLFPYVEDEKYRSKTTYVVKCDFEVQERIKKELEKKGFILWGWYWKLKKDTFRIGNFPAISIEDLEEAFEVINNIKF